MFGSVKAKIRIGCKTELIEGYESIDERLDIAFKILYTWFYWDKLDSTKLDEEHLPHIENVGIDYIKNQSDTKTTMKYFKNLRVIRTEYVARGS